MTDERLSLEGELEKKENWIHQLQEDVVKMKDETRGKDLAIQALSQTLIEKGEENQKMSEMVSQIKNHLLTTDTYN